MLLNLSNWLLFWLIKLKNETKVKQWKKKVSGIYFNQLNYVFEVGSIRQQSQREKLCKISGTITEIIIAVILMYSVHPK